MDKPLTLREFAERIRKDEERMTRDMIEMLYAPNPFLDDMEPPKPLTLRKRLSIYVQRARDAWAVLTGRAEIGGY